MYEKLKAFLHDDTLFTVFLLLLVGIVSFGLGRQSMLESAPESSNIPVLQELAPLQVSNVLEYTEGDIQVVGSKSGTKYHLFNCPGAKQIKVSNRIEFVSTNAAEAAGYSPAANCAGLQ